MSVNSMKTSHKNTLKKIEKAGGKVDSDGNGSVATTPKKTAGKKRAGSPGGDDEETPPAPKKGRKKKAAKEAAVDCTYCHDAPYQTHFTNLCIAAEEDATKEEATKDLVTPVKTKVED